MKDQFDDSIPRGSDCAFCGGGSGGGIPTDRVIERLDELFGKNDTAGAKRHLDYWLAEAEALGDKRGELAVLDEMIGFCRKNGDREGAFAAAGRASELVKELGLEDTVTDATVILNTATACKAFDMNQRAYELYSAAKKIYEARLPAGDPKLAGLYNNTALACAALGRYDEAEELYEAALAIVTGSAELGTDAAITYLNMADLTALSRGLEDGAEEIEELLEKAKACLEDPALPRGGYYAFVASGCAPVFEYYGMFAYAAELAARAEDIYAGT